MRAATKQPADFWFFASVVMLVIVGILLVFDSSFARAGDRGMQDAWFFVKRQMLWAAIGFLGLMVAMRIHPAKFRAISKISVLAAIGLLCMVMVPHVGKSIAGAARWIPIGPFHLQPSEVAKLAIVFYLADRLASKGLRIKTPVTLIPEIAVVGLVAMLVLIEPDMGTASMIIFTTAVMLFVAGVRKRHIFSAAGIMGLLGYIFVRIEPYRMERVTTFLHPGKDYYGSGYQIIHSLIAQATGGLTGLGFCEGREKFFIPAPQTDMIGATLAEEAGFIGMLVLLALFVLFTYRGLSISHRAKSSYMSLLATGITSLISLQALTNIAVLTSSIPATGVPLSFISYGGSYIMVMLFGAGIVLSVSRHVDEPGKEPELEDYESRSHRRRNGRAYIPCTEYRTGTGRVRRRTTVRR